MHNNPQSGFLKQECLIRVIVGVVGGSLACFPGRLKDGSTLSEISTEGKDLGASECEDTELAGLGRNQLLQTEDMD